MEITAIWERPAANERYSNVFVLCKDGRFLAVTHYLENDGRNKDGSIRTIETGQPEFSSAFPDKDDWDFQKANYFIRHFGGVLIQRF